MPFDFNYKPDGETLRRYMTSEAFVRGLQGPIGSGKSVASIAECMKLMIGQERSIDPKTGLRTGKRKVRIGVVRNTTPQLETTTMQSWLEWLPEDEVGKVRWRPPYRQDISIPELDLEVQVWFLALDREEDVRKLLSFEFTFIWLNEARELHRGVVTAAISRVNRFPRIIEGGATRACVMMDTNAPAKEHWWAIMSGQSEPPDWMPQEDLLTMVKPANWEFFIQPPAVLDVMDAQGELVGYELNPGRENGKYTAESYYMDLIQGQTRDWIQNMLQNRIGQLFHGRPVYSGYREETHVTAEPIEIDPNYPVHCGVDFGLTPAVWFGQDVRRQVRAIDEIVTRDTSTAELVEILKKHLNEFYGEIKVIFTGDPAGTGRAQTDKNTPFQIFKAAGIDIRAAWTNEPDIRIGSVETQLNTLIEGRPAYILSPLCTYLMAAKAGGYCFKKDSEEIDKGSIYSHISDAEQYAVLRMGYGKKLIGREKLKKLAQQANVRQNILARPHGGVRPNRSQTILSRGLRRRSP